ncbi:MAG: hypothetical protein JWQ19_666 [Subtercola sp.]|nr:hypothetical protein [Subtercola sp.]
MTSRPPSRSDGGRGREPMWRNLLIGEGVFLIVILAIFSTDYSAVVWLAVAVFAVTTPIVVVGLLRSRGRG